MGYEEEAGVYGSEVKPVGR